ncbi:MAG: aldehyde dehydrogenase family protein, partial [Luteimonas sp.]|nr:aldehyde dehydrogenase family protein [Luteimonas sp.]
MTSGSNESVKRVPPDNADHKIDRLRGALAAQAHGLLINGEWRGACGGAAIEVDDPATGQALASVAAGGAEDVEHAVTAARRAFRSGPWPRMPSSRRAALMFALADAIEARQDEFALLESLDAGHTLTSIRSGDIPLGIRALRDYAGLATRMGGEVPVQPSDATFMDYFLREPVGVCALITPWNAPFLMAIQKLAAALAAGCTAVLKPAELAPLTALRIGELCVAVGIPTGVVNVVTGRGDEAGQALVDHRDVNLVSFTGSTPVGRSIMASAAHSNLKRVVLELGGKSPVIVLADADLDRAAQAIVAEITFKSGQYCAAGSRVFVQRSVHAALLTRLHAAMDAVRIGAGQGEGVDMGPMISNEQRDRALDILTHSAAMGATILRGGGRVAGPGYFFEPTLVVDATPQMRISNEEIFAPVLVVTAFEESTSLDEIAALANDSQYGLSSKVWSGDLR